MIVAFVVSLFAVAAFGAALWKSGVVRVSQAATATAFSGLSAMVDRELDDDSKEIAVRRAAFSLLKAALSIALRFAIVLAAASLPILLADLLGFASLEAVMSLMLRLDYLVGVSIAVLALGAFIRKLRPRVVPDDPRSQGYSPSEQFIHGLAFSSPGILKTASWLEDRVMPQVAKTPSAPPIFITSIARGGTTALLNVFHDMPGIATHTYRDMPFLTAPRLWDKLSGGSRRQVARRGRAHGDGLQIDLDTPEAFEEVLWKMFWPQKYRGVGIEMWSEADRNPDADRFFMRHMAKIIGARQVSANLCSTSQAVYCSKNNANIARLSYLADSYPGCRLVVPVRRPESHAASLNRQHQNFLKQQADDTFVARYMRDIGHFEFGLIHKPLLFPDFQINAFEPASPDYWLDYWLHGFRHVWENRERCLFVLQDDLRARPVETMSALCSTLEVETGPLDFTSYFRPGADKVKTDCFAPALLAEADALYKKFSDLSRRQLGPLQA